MFEALQGQYCVFPMCCMCLRRSYGKTIRRLLVAAAETLGKWKNEHQKTIKEKETRKTVMDISSFSLVFYHLQAQKQTFNSHII